MTIATKKLDLRLPADMRDELDRIAEELTTEDKKVFPADIARQAIDHWLKFGRIEAPDEPMVKRGGNRRHFDTEPKSA